MNGIGRKIKQARERKRMTQQELANRIPGMGRTSISKYENGHPIGNEVLKKIAEALEDPIFELEVNGRAISCFYLDNVNMDPLATLNKAMEEMKEAIWEIEHLDIINKVKPEDLTEAERDQLLKKTMMEFQDVNICMDLVLVSLAQKFDIDLKELERLSKQKMEERGYRSRELAVAK